MITRTDDHHYIYQGVTYPGVTSILKMLDKSGPLMGWAARQTAEAAVGLLDKLPDMLATVGPEGVIRALTTRKDWTNDTAKMLGTDVHAMAELVATGQTLPPMESTVHTRVTHYAEWWASSGWTPRAVEALLVNPTIGYGGTLDLLCRDRDGRTVLADVKTGRAVYQDVALQLAAYGMAEVIQVADQDAVGGRGGVFTMPAVDRYAVIHVTATGVREVELAVGDIDREAFGCCLGLSKWAEFVKGRTL